MARPFYREVPNGIFHVTSRGAARRTIFEDGRDHRGFLAELKLVSLRYRWRCLSFCLMGNHFHLLVQTPDEGLAEGMRDLKSAYAQAFQRRRGADGPLFKARPWRQLIQDDAYLLTAAVYIARNPVRAGQVSDPVDWPWSSLATTVAGQRTFVDPAPILDLLHEDPAIARRDFEALCRDPHGLPEFDPSLPIVGDEDFVARHAPEERPSRYVAKHAWEQARPPLGVLSAGRAEAQFIAEARNAWHYTLGEIAAHLGCSERTVQRRLSCAGTRPL